MQFTARKEVGSETGEPAEPPDPVSWKATLGIIGIFCLGAMLTQVVVAVALFLGPKLLP